MAGGIRNTINERRSNSNVSARSPRRSGRPDNDDAGTQELPRQPRREERAYASALVAVPGAVAVPGTRDEELDGTVEYRMGGEESLSPISAQVVNTEDETERLRDEVHLLREQLRLRREHDQMQNEREDLRQRLENAEEENRRLVELEERMQQRMEKTEEEIRSLREQEQMRQLEYTQENPVYLEHLSRANVDVAQGVTIGVDEGSEGADIQNFHKRDERADKNSRALQFSGFFECGPANRLRSICVRMWSTKHSRRLGLAGLLTLLVVILIVVLSVVLTRETSAPSLVPFTTTCNTCPCESYVNEGMSCFRSHREAGPDASVFYPNGQNCTFAAGAGGFLDVRYFDVEYEATCGLDSFEVTVTSTNYCGFLGPHGVEVSAGDIFEWSTNDNETFRGFDICLVNEQPAEAAITVFGDAPPCIVDRDSEGRYCFKSHAEAGPDYSVFYENGQRCLFTAAAGGFLDVRHFDVEYEESCGLDSFEVTTTATITTYCGLLGPHGVKVSAGDTFRWSTNENENRRGFDICLVNEPPAEAAITVAGDAPPCIVDRDSDGNYCLKLQAEAGSNASVLNADNQNCTFTAETHGFLDVRYFNVTCGSEGFEVVATSTRYCGSVGPHGTEVSTGDRFEWSKNDAETRQGFNICLVNELPPETSEAAITVAGDAPPCIVDLDSEGNYCLKSHLEADPFATVLYANDQKCTFTAGVDGYLDVRHFYVEYEDTCELDSLEVTATSTRYCGVFGPHGVKVSAGDTFEWSTNVNGTGKGFNVCLVNEPPREKAAIVVAGDAPPCIVDRDSEGTYCFKSHAGAGSSSYLNSQNCVFTINTIAGLLDVRTFSTEFCCDHLVLTTFVGETTSYEGINGPDNVSVNPGDIFQWTTDSSTTGVGFDICIV